MKLEQKSLRIGAAVILIAVMLRFLGPFTDVSAFHIHPDLASFLLYIGTGRIYSTDEPEPSSLETPKVPPTEPEATQPEPTQPLYVQQVFSADDAELVSVTNHPGYDIDVAAMLETPLVWDLTEKSPTVLIIHSHTCESYENTEGYTPSDPYRTMDERYNMVSIGKHLADCLQQKGISVLHDTTIHDYPSYNDAYPQSRKTVQQYLQEYPTIQLVLDIHRDAYEDKSGNQARNTVSINGKASSRLMLVAGTNAYGQGHPNWEENLSMAVKLQTVLQRLYPGLCRNLTMRSSAFNQDLSPGSLLIEVGTAGDTRQDALYAAELLADGIAELAYGSK